jgi:hypothetical protein
MWRCQTEVSCKSFFKNSRRPHVDWRQNMNDLVTELEKGLIRMMRRFR